MRDVAAYLIASAVTLALLWDGAFARYEAIVQILLYMLYLSICIYTSRCAIGHPSGQCRPVGVCQSAIITQISRQREDHKDGVRVWMSRAAVCRGGAPVAPVQHHAALPTSSPRIARRSSDPQEVQLADASAFVTLNGGGGSGGKGPSAAAQRLLSGQLANGHPRGAELPNGIGRTAAAAQRASAVASPKAARLPGAAGGAAPLLRSAAARRLAELAQFQTTSSSFGSSGATPESPLPVSTDLEFPVAAAAVAAVPWSAETGLQHQAGADGPTNSLLTCGCSSQLSRAAQRALTAAQAVCAEHLHLHGSWPWDGVVLATAPLVLLMHATMPAVGRGAFLPPHSSILSSVLTAFLDMPASLRALHLSHCRVHAPTMLSPSFL